MVTRGAALAPRRGLLALGALRRLIGAAAGAAVLWLAVWWALS